MNVDRVSKLIDEIGEIVFDMEAKSHEDGCEFVWSDFGWSIYKRINEVQRHIEDEVEFYNKINKI